MQDTNAEPDITPEQLAASKLLATRRLHPNIVGQSLNISGWELIALHAPVLNEAAEIRTKNVISDSLYEMAASKQNTAATISWVKAYGHPATTPPPARTDKPEKEKPYVWDPNDPNDRVIFSVYNNDGEPNHDY